MTHRFFSLLAGLTFVSPLTAAEKLTSVTVEAGAFDRRNTIVSFAPPSTMEEVAALRRDGKVIPLQIDKRGRGWFIIDDLKKGSKATYEVVIGDAARPTSVPTVFANRDGSQLKMSFARVNGGAVATPLPLMDYQAEPGDLPREDIKPAFKRGAYLHPIRTLNGKVVTDDFPPNHIHHHGVWWAWTNTEFDGRKPDFWNMGEGKGRVDFESLDESWSGPVHAGFRARHRFTDLLAAPAVTALNETWDVKVFGPPGRALNYWVFDFVSEQHCATRHGIKLPEYRYGGIGLRGNWAWNGKTNVSFLTSDGETDRVKGNTQLGRWCDMSGLLDGAFAGITILCHPANFRAPQPMRLHPTEPFFNFAPQQAGDMELKPGEPYVARYRFVVHDGPPNKAELDRLWNDYAHPPVATAK